MVLEHMNILEGDFSGLYKEDNGRESRTAKVDLEPAAGKNHLFARNSSDDGKAGCR